MRLKISSIRDEIIFINLINLNFDWSKCFKRIGCYVVVLNNYLFDMTFNWKTFDGINIDGKNYKHYLGITILTIEFYLYWGKK